MILLAGLVAAAAAYGWATFQTRRADRGIRGLEVKCETEVREETSKNGLHLDVRSGVKLSDLLRRDYRETCSPEVILPRAEDEALRDVPFTATQFEILDTYRNRRDAWYSDDSWIVGGVIVSTIPWLSTWCWTDSQS
jgi:hypothetical protein